MKMKWWLILGFVFACTGIVWACSLPAEPSAAALPDSGNPNVKVVSTGANSFYYLVPEGTQIQLKVVWDPYDHKGGNLGSKWGWCANKNVAGASGVLQPSPTSVSYDGKNSGPRFYDLAAMNAFFSNLTMQGDAVSDELGNPPSNQLQDAALVKPSFLLKQAFVKGDNQAFANIIPGDRVPGYPDTSGFCNPSGNNLPVDDLDSELPNDSGLFSPKDSGSWNVDTTKSPRERYWYSYVSLSPKMYLGQVTISPQVPALSEYKAYILEGGPNVWTDQGNLPSGPSGFQGGAPGPSFAASFWVPTLGAAQDEVKVKVYCPSAGFLLKDIGWAWEEKLVTQVASTTDINGNAVLDDFEANPPETTTIRKCSVGIQVFVTKGGKGTGYTAYKVFDTRPPLASNFKLTNKPTLTKGQKMGNFGFELEMADTNPWGDKTVSLSAGGITIDQNPDKVKNSVKIFYSYPVYEYKARTGIGDGDLCTVKAGALEAESVGAATWKGVYYKPYWVWKEAVVAPGTPTFTQKFDGGKLVGGVWKITGTADFEQPVPWHFSTPMDSYTDPDGGVHPSANTSDPTKLIKVFALVKDSNGKSCVAYDSIVPFSVADQKNTNLHADEDAAAIFDPKVGVAALETAHNEKPPMTAAVAGWAGVSGGNYLWQKFDYVNSVPDTIKPEIEVFIFDQRKNKYHTFGTKAGGWAKYTDLAAKYEQCYKALSPIPFSDEAALTTGMLFQTANDALFNDFYTTNKSLVSADQCSQFICQQNTRLTFHVRAWDNVNTFQGDKGMATINYALVDNAAPNTDTRPAGLWDPVSGVTPKPYWTFRTANAGGEECSFTVNATDKAGNASVLKINFKVVGEELNVRSLEEQRYRTNGAP